MMTSSVGWFIKDPHAGSEDAATTSSFYRYYTSLYTSHSQYSHI